VVLGLAATRADAEAAERRRFEEGGGKTVIGTTYAESIRPTNVKSSSVSDQEGVVVTERPIVRRAPISYSTAPLPPATERREVVDSALVSRRETVRLVETSPARYEAPIDLRPSAVRASYGAAAVAYGRESQSRTQTAGLTSAPPRGLSEPYAGPPYEVDGKWYVPAHEPDYDEVGLASWYGPTFHGKASASGETFDEMAMTAAHPTLPIPSLVRVTNLANGRSAVLRLNDRGPFVDDRIIDLSKGAALALDMKEKGLVQVRVQYVGPAPEAGADARLVSYQRSDRSPAPGGSGPATLIASRAPMPALVPVQAQSVADEGYFVQVGAFADLGNAHRRRAELSGAGQVSVRSIMRNGGEYFRVMLGPWRSRAEAEAARDRLGAAGEGALIVAASDN
jgi:rare lipoprotein A